MDADLDLDRDLDRDPAPESGFFTRDEVLDLDEPLVCEDDDLRECDLDETLPRRLPWGSSAGIERNVSGGCSEGLVGPDGASSESPGPPTGAPTDTPAETPAETSFSIRITGPWRATSSARFTDDARDGDCEKSDGVLAATASGFSTMLADGVAYGDWR